MLVLLLNKILVSGYIDSVVHWGLLTVKKSMSLSPDGSTLLRKKKKLLASELAKEGLDKCPDSYLAAVGNMLAGEGSFEAEEISRYKRLVNIYDSNKTVPQAELTRERTNIHTIECLANAWKALTRTKGWTNQVIAALAGVSEYQILRMCDKKVGTRRLNIEKVAKVLGVRLEKLVAPEKLSITQTDIEAVPYISDFALDISSFVGREEELHSLEQLVVNKEYRLVVLVGSGGMGKSFLARKLQEEHKEEFELNIWKRLEGAPSFADFLKFLSDYKDFPSSFLDNSNNNVLQLIKLLQSKRCLVVLDNFESVMREDGTYLEGCEDYRSLLREVGTTDHKSCLIITTKKNPVQVLNVKPKVKHFPIRGLQLEDAKQLLADFNLQGSNDEWQTFINYYGGNPFALELKAATESSSSLCELLRKINNREREHEEITELLESQFNILSTEEKEIFYWLAINFEPVSYESLSRDIVLDQSINNLSNNLRKLANNLLIEKTGEYYTLHPVVRDYVLEKFIEVIVNEIQTSNLKLFKSHTLVKAQAKAYIRNTQARVLVVQIIKRLLLKYRKLDEIETKLKEIVKYLQTEDRSLTGYAVVNISNLLFQVQGTTDLSRYNFSNLTIRQADFSNVKLHDVVFQKCILENCVFSNSLGSVLSIAFSPCGKFLAASGITGRIYLWEAESFKLIRVFEAHDAWIWTIKFTFDGRYLASAGDDQIVKCWDLEELKNKNSMLEEIQAKEIGDAQATVRDLSLTSDSDNNIIIASASDNGCVKVWRIRESASEHIIDIKQHKDRVRSVCFNPKYPQLLASSEGEVIKVWKINIQNRKYELVGELPGHSAEVRTICWSPNGIDIVSGGDDGRVLLWRNYKTAQHRELGKHKNWVRSVDFSADGYVLSASEDQTIKVWDVNEGNFQLLKEIQEHTSWVQSVRFNPKNNTMFASGGADRQVILHDIKQGLISTIKGYTNFVFSVAFSPDGKELAVGYEDGILRIWNIKTGEYQKLRGHQGWIRSVTFSSDNQWLASSGEDRKIVLWQRQPEQTFRKVKELTGHKSWIRQVRFSPTDKILVSCSDDKTIKFYKYENETTDFQSLTKDNGGHLDWIRSISFSPDGSFLASGSGDKTIKIWQKNEDGIWANCQTLTREEDDGHDDWVWSVAFSPDGKYLATASGDRKVKIWFLTEANGSKRWKYYRTLEQHQRSVRIVAFNTTGTYLASGSIDKTVILWNTQTWQPICDSQQNLVTLNHNDWVRTLAFRQQEHQQEYLATASQDGIIKLWNIQYLEGEGIQLLKELKLPALYEGMDITNVEGLSLGEIKTLKDLGAKVNENQ
jgi:WD40 repeat protein